MDARGHRSTRPGVRHQAPRAFLRSVENNLVLARNATTGEPEPTMIALGPESISRPPTSKEQRYRDALPATITGSRGNSRKDATLGVCCYTRQPDGVRP